MGKQREMWPSPPFLFPPLASPLVAALSALSVVMGASMSVSELRGENLAYSKFRHRGGDRGLPGRVGMLVAYAPALVAALASFVMLGAVDGQRARLLAAALSVHFLKRVLFMHRYSGSMPLTAATTISIGYIGNVVVMIYAQRLSRGLPDPAVDLLYPGVVVFAVGFAGNFYHHYLLAKLRAAGGGNGEGKGYKVPRGGLFELVTCPHYLFEIVVFFGFAMIAQTVFSLALACSVAEYLAGRSLATRKWYAAKFEEFPARVKALVPYVL